MKRECLFTYLVSELAFAVHLVVLAEFGAEFVNVGSGRSELIVQSEALKTAAHEL